MADTSSLKNRALVFAFATTPYIVTTFIGPRAAQSYLETSGWPWGYGTFAVITPVIALPIISVLYLNQRKARREGLLVSVESGRSLVQDIKFYFWEFDGNLCHVGFPTPANMLHSDWAPSHLCWLCSLPPSVLSGSIPVQRMEVRDDHCNASGWYNLPNCLCPL